MRDHRFIIGNVGKDMLQLAGDLREFLHQRRRVFGISVPRTCPMYMPRITRAVICEVKALVEATPISGPACVISVPFASRVIMDPTTLQMASVFEPFCFASRGRPEYRRFRRIAK